MPQKEYKPDRFEEPRASVTKFPAGGTSFMGLPEKNGKHILKHSFEADKAYQNLAAAEAAQQIPVGQRHDSQREFQNRLEQKRMNYNDWKCPERNPSREHLTSVDNPLRNLKIIPQPEVEAPVHSIKTYPRNTHMGTMAHLAPGTLEPLSRAEVRAARASANQMSRESSPARQRDAGGRPVGACKLQPGKRPDSNEVEDDRQGDEEERGRILEASEEGECDEEGSQYSHDEDAGDLMKMDCSEKEALRNAALQQVAQEVAMLKEVESRLIKEYPHGVPKIIIMRVQKELGLQLPSLGFGEAQSLSDKMARASLRA